MYNIILALLQNLQLRNNVRQIINDYIYALVKDLCEYFTQLNISQMSFIQNNYNIIITIISNRKKIMLVNLIFSELMSFTVVLTAHFFHMLQLQNSQLQSTSMMLMNDSSFQTDFTAKDNCNLS